MIRFFHNLSLAARTALITVVWMGIILGGIIYFCYTGFEESILSEASAKNNLLAEMMAAQIQTEMLWTEKVVRQAAHDIFYHPLTRENMIRIMGNAINAQHNSLGGLVIFTPEFKGKAEYENLYLSRMPDSSVFYIDDRDVATDYVADWYNLPYQMRCPFWSEPYFDPIVKEMMITYSYPVYQDSALIAIVTSDISTTWIQRTIDATKFNNEGNAFVTTSHGLIVAHPDTSLILAETLLSLAESSVNEETRVCFSDMSYQLLSSTHGEKKCRSFRTGRNTFIYYKRIEGCNWYAGIAVDEDVLTADLNELTLTMWLVGSGGFLILLFSSISLAVSFTRPFVKLGKVADKLAQGAFDTPIVDMHAGKEIDAFVRSFRQMRNDLRTYVYELTHATATKEKIQSELSIAREIQMSIVPKLLPPFPYNPRIDLFAKLEPALEVGGDFYDFGFLDEEHFYIGIGDVSGKGIAASLLMAVSKTLLKSAIHNFKDPGRALTAVNKEIASNNDACMFITIFAGVLNIQTGQLLWSSAGHNPPVIFKHPNKSSYWLKCPTEPPVGPFDFVTYKTYSETLAPADGLLIYTDGITEAMTREKKMYGEERLIKFVTEHGQKPANELLDTLYTEVHGFAGDAAQSDDMTTLFVRIIPPNTHEQSVSIPPYNGKIILKKHLEELNRLVPWLEETSEKCGILNPVMMKLNLVLEEWFVNIVSYAFPDGDEHDIVIGIAMQDEKIWVRIEDDGLPFDPTAADDVDTAQPVEQRRIGGLGIHFIREVMDEFHYARVDGKNQITMLTRNEILP